MFEVQYRKKAAQVATGQKLHVGLKKCVTITVGFIFPCGEVEIGGCWETSKAAARKALPKAMFLGSPTEIILDPDKDMKAVEKAFIAKVAK